MWQVFEVFFLTWRHIIKNGKGVRRVTTRHTPFSTTRSVMERSKVVGGAPTAGVKQCCATPVGRRERRGTGGAQERGDDRSLDPTATTRKAPPLPRSCRHWRSFGSRLCSALPSLTGEGQGSYARG